MQRKCHKCNKLFTPEPASRTLCYECMPGEEPMLPGKLDKDMVAQIKKKDEAAKQHYYKKYISRKERMPMIKKECEGCGNEFETNAANRRFCYDCRPSTIKKEEKEPYMAKDDMVNHPSHYTDGRIEVIDYIEDKGLNYHRGNAVKYISRSGKKDAAKEVEDLKKAVWYLNREIERIQRK